MAKKKTRVLLPGGIQGLVKGLQNGTSEYAPQPLVDEEAVVRGHAEAEEELHDDSLETEEARAGEPAKDVVYQGDAAGNVETPNQHDHVAATNKEDVAAPQPTVVAEERADAEVSARGRKPKENTIKEYHIVKDDSKDSWDLFIDMAKQYKQGGGKLATIYIDETLKSVLDRMKYAGPDKLSTSAILSSIVARFIYDHEDEIKKALFSGNLL